MNDNRKVYRVHRGRRRSRKSGHFRLLLLLLCCFGAVAFYWVSAFGFKMQAVPVTANTSSALSISSAVSKVESPSSVESKSEPQSSQMPEISLEKADKPIWIRVDISSQKVSVYDAKNRLVNNYICSTGKDGDDTPTGTFTVKERGKSFFSKQYQEGAYYWTQFKGDFLFHSVPFDKNREIEQVEAQKLGTKASHGCVRLSMEDAKWIYDNAPRGTKVVIE